MTETFRVVLLNPSSQAVNALASAQQLQVYRSLSNASVKFFWQIFFFTDDIQKRSI
jgi:hypothetical protein